MKKAKLMLSAVAVLGIVGGALAFKAKSFDNPNLAICTTNAAGQGTCKTSLYNEVSGTPTTFPTSLAWRTTTTQTCNPAQPSATQCGSVHPTTIFLNP